MTRDMNPIALVAFVTYAARPVKYFFLGWLDPLLMKPVEHGAGPPSEKVP